MNKIIRAASIAASVAAALFLSSEVRAAAPAAPQGFITSREWLNLAGTTLDQLTNTTLNPKFPDSPDAEYYPARFEWPTGEDDATPPIGNVQNNYGVQVIGYFYPPTTGVYKFAIAADDNALIYLSTDATPANKVRIAIEAGWNPVRNWDGQLNGRTLIDVGTPDERWDNQSKGISLTAGQAYYIEGLMKEGGGGDNIAIAYRTDGTWPTVDGGDLPIPGSQLATINKTTGPVNITTQPASQAVLEGVPVSFGVVVDGTPPYTYQWKKGGTDILDATNRTYSIQFAATGDAGDYTVLVTGGAGAPVTSNPATLTVNVDNVKPTIASASGSPDLRHATVVYSERIEEASATNSANYTIAGLAVTSGRLLNDTTVELTTALQTTNTTYTLTVNNVRDRAFVPNVIVAATQVQFKSAQFKTGLANWSRWQDQAGDTTPIDTFAANVIDPAFRGPDATGVSPYLGGPRGVADNYGLKANCYFIAPSTANYVFFIACDDLGYLYLSTDSNPANKKLIAAQPAWSDQNQWLDPDLDRTMGLAQNASDQYDASEWPTPNVISLTAGTQYYVEFLFQEGGGGDGGEVTYKLVTDADPVNGDAPKMTGTVIGSYVDPAVLPPLITQRPVGTNYNKGDTLTFSVTADSVLPVTYQWYQNKVAIPGPAGTGNPLVIANADHKAVGDYSVTVANANGSISSYPDDNVRALMLGVAFIIEAEDFNYASGQTKPEASVMPYLGNAYTNITSQVNNVDFFNTGDETGTPPATDAYKYGRFAYVDPADPNVPVMAIKGPADPADYNRGGFSVTVNYGIGWTDAGEWQNYTRTFPAGNYAIIAGIAFGGTGATDINTFLSSVANPTIPDGSTPGVEGKLQGVTKLGSFKGPGTGAWSSNDLIPLTDDSGNLVQVALSGTQTLRWSANKADGDMDYLLFYNVGSVGPKLSVAASPTGAPVITFEGTLESEGAIPGTWAPVAGAISPYTVTPSGTQQFYRAKQ